MKKTLTLISVLAAVLVASVLATFNVTPAFAASCSNYGEAGYFSTSIPGVGGQFDEPMQALSASYQGSGNFRNYLSVSNAGNQSPPNTDTFQAGLISDGHVGQDGSTGLQRYVEYDGQFLLRINANKNTIYQPYFTKVASGTWTVNFAGHSYTKSVINTGLVNLMTSQAGASTCSTFGFSDDGGIYYGPLYANSAAEQGYCPYAFISYQASGTNTWRVGSACGIPV
jgi:hypothetical protein